MRELQSDTVECPRCHQVKPTEDFYRVSTRPNGLSHKCKQCIGELNKTQKYKATKQKYVQTHRDKYRDWQKRWDKTHPLRRKEIDRCFRLRRKQKVISHYGGQCACCGEKILDFLAIDHIDGGGSQERKRLKMGGNGIYLFIIKNDFPSGFRVLCHNCNWGIHVNNGICPHKLDQPANLT